MLFLYLYFYSIISFPVKNLYRPLCDESKLDLPMSFDENIIEPVARFAGYQDLIIDLKFIVFYKGEDIGIPSNETFDAQIDILNRAFSGEMSA